MKPFARSNWERAILVCGKCSRKLGGGFGPKGKTSLAKALRREPDVGKGRKARIGVAEVKCLGVCPKGAVTVVDSADLGRWRLIPLGAPAAAVLGRTTDPEPPVSIALSVSETLVVLADQPPA